MAVNFEDEESMTSGRFAVSYNNNTGSGLIGLLVRSHIVPNEDVAHKVLLVIACLAFIATGIVIAPGVYASIKTAVTPRTPIIDPYANLSEAAKERIPSDLMEKVRAQARARARASI